MVCLHHPPVQMGSAWLDTVGLDDGDDSLPRASSRPSGRVRAAIFGHVHQATIRSMHDDMRIVATPSTCRQFKPGSDEFAVDNNPPAYRRIELRADGGFDSELIWVDDA